MDLRKELLLRASGVERREKTAKAREQERLWAECANTLDGLIGLYGPYTFLRELAQNAIDAQVEAGTPPRVDYITDFVRYETGSDGTHSLYLSDNGIGMNRRAVDIYLTQIRGTTRSNSERYIGEFGIGFISVFAFEPYAVIVDTGRKDDCLRVIFKQNRRFDRIDLNNRVAGTQVQVVKILHNRDVESVESSMKASLSHWCRMSRVPITFNGESINAAFALEGPGSFTIEPRDGLLERVSIAPIQDDQPRYELYKHGFLVESGDESELSLPHLRYRVESQALELSYGRDSVKREPSLQRVIKALKRVVDQLYTSHLVQQQAEEPHDLAWELLSHRLELLSRKHLSTPLVPASDGTKLSLLQLAAQVQNDTLQWTSRRDVSRNLPLWDGESPGLERLLTSGWLAERRLSARLKNYWLGRHRPTVSLKRADD